MHAPQRLSLSPRWLVASQGLLLRCCLSGGWLPLSQSGGLQVGKERGRGCGVETRHPAGEQLVGGSHAVSALGGGGLRTPPSVAACSSAPGTFGDLSQWPTCKCNIPWESIASSSPGCSSCRLRRHPAASGQAARSCPWQPSAGYSAPPAHWKQAADLPPLWHFP